MIDNLTGIGQAYAYHMKERDSQPCRRTVFVVDVGAGKIDAGLLDITNDCVKINQKGGDCQFGGQDFDFVLASFLENQSQERAIASLDKVEQARVRCQALRCCRRAKEASSKVSSTHIDLRFPELSKQPNAQSFQVKREIFKVGKFEELFQKIETMMQRVFRTTDQRKVNIDDVVLIGGACEMPFIRPRILGCLP
jgi:molecular chaperone DnaK (HSP70)